MKPFQDYFVSGLRAMLLAYTVNVSAQTVLPETTNANPALARFVDQTSTLPPALFVAWTGTDSANHLNVLGSTNGNVWDDNRKVVLPETDLQGPALASGHNAALYAAWTGTDSDHHLNVVFSMDGRQFGGKVTLGETSFHSPALAYSGHSLFLAWTGTDRRLNVARLAATGANFGQILSKVTLNETSDQAPALAAVGQTLYLAWSGTNSQHNLNVIESVNGGDSWQGKATLNETTAMQPALAIHPRSRAVYLAWTGTDSAHHLNYLIARLGSTVFSQKQTIDQTSSAGPALAEFQDVMYVSWSGTDAEHHLNVAPL